MPGSAQAPRNGRAAAAKPAPSRLDRLPPQTFFLVSAIFHYLGPALAVLLFARVDVLGVAWFRIASAAVVFAVWRRPWRLLTRLDRPQLHLLLSLGAVLAAMNTCFYLAIDKLPLSTVGSIEFLGTVILAVAGARTRRNFVALGLTTTGVAAVTAIRLAGQPAGFALAFGNCVLFMLYVVLGHRIASLRPAGDENSPAGLDLLAASMLVAAVVVTPIGLPGALPAFSHRELLLAGIGVGVCSSVIPYVTDQLAMARMSRATFALMLALLPVSATIIGAIVLRQFPTPLDLAGIALVTTGVAIHHEDHPRKGVTNHGLRAARQHGPEGLPHLPRHDELRQQGRARLASDRG
jgi:inner membrane transporter RhtA